MRVLVTLSLIVVGIIHLLPLSGVLGGAQLTSLYGMAFDEANLSILMRHRAMLFGILGLFLLVAAFRPKFQLAAFVAGFASVLSFLGLAAVTGGYNAQLGRVIAVDLVALACLVVGVFAFALESRRHRGE